MLNEVELGMKAVVGDGRLLVDYALTVRGSLNLITFDGAIGLAHGEYPDLTRACYISFSGEGTVCLMLTRPPPHPLKDSARTFIPPVAEVKAGNVRRVGFGIPLPLRERSEFSPEFAGATYAPQSASRIELRIGCFWRTDETVLSSLGPPNVWRAAKGAPLSKIFQVTATAAVLLDVFVRTDAQFIRM